MICSHTPERSLPFPLPGSAMNRREVQGKTIQTRHICYSYRPKDLHNLLEDFSLVIFPSSSLIQQTRPVTGIHPKLKNSWFFSPTLWFWPVSEKPQYYLDVLWVIIPKFGVCIVQGILPKNLPSPFHQTACHYNPGDQQCQATAIRSIQGSNNQSGDKMTTLLWTTETKSLWCSIS